MTPEPDPKPEPDPRQDVVESKGYLLHPMQVFVFDFREPTAEDLARPRYGRPDRSHLLKPTNNNK